MRVGDADKAEGAKRVHVFRQRHANAVAAQNIGEFDNPLFHREPWIPSSNADDLSRFAGARSLAGFPFGQVGFEFLVRFANVGFVLHQRRQGLLHQLVVQLFDIEQGQRPHPVEGLADARSFFQVELAHPVQQRTTSRAS